MGANKMGFKCVADLYEIDSDDKTRILYTSSSRRLHFLQLIPGPGFMRNMMTPTQKHVIIIHPKTVPICWYTHTSTKVTHTHAWGNSDDFATLMCALLCLCLGRSRRERQMKYPRNCNYQHLLTAPGHDVRCRISKCPSKWCVRNLFVIRIVSN